MLFIFHIFIGAWHAKYSAIFVVLLLRKVLHLIIINNWIDPPSKTCYETFHFLNGNTYWGLEEHWSHWSHTFCLVHLVRYILHPIKIAENITTWLPFRITFEIRISFSNNKWKIIHHLESHIICCAIIS